MLRISEFTRWDSSNSTLSRKSRIWCLCGILGVSSSGLGVFLGPILSDSICKTGGDEFFFVSAGFCSSESAGKLCTWENSKIVCFLHIARQNVRPRKQLMEPSERFKGWNLTASKKLLALVCCLHIYKRAECVPNQNHSSASHSLQQYQCITLPCRRMDKVSCIHGSSTGLRGRYNHGVEPDYWSSCSETTKSNRDNLWDKISIFCRYFVFIIKTSWAIRWLVVGLLESIKRPQKTNAIL